MRLLAKKNFETTVFHSCEIKNTTFEIVWHLAKQEF